MVEMIYSCRYFIKFSFWKGLGHEKKTNTLVIMKIYFISDNKKYVY